MVSINSHYMKEIIKQYLKRTKQFKNILSMHFLNYGFSVNLHKKQEHPVKFEIHVL